MYMYVPLLLLSSISLSACYAAEKKTLDIIPDEIEQVAHAQKNHSNIIYLHEQTEKRSGQDILQNIVSTGNVIVDFYADWCGPCKNLGRTIEQIASDHTAIIFLKVNVDLFPDIAQNFGIKSIPVLIFYKNGQKLKTISGSKNKNELENLIQSMY
jgi:thioredoxin 1